MTQIFISYAKEDCFCARLLQATLETEKFSVWQFQVSLRPGFQWREDIERGIDNSDLIVVIISKSSAASQYVTFEWAYALGKQKAILPIRIDDCVAHPRLEVVQQMKIDEPSKEILKEFVNKAKSLLGEYEGAVSPGKSVEVDLKKKPTIDMEQLENGIRAYLNARGFSAISFDRIRDKVDKNATDDDLYRFIKESADFAPGIMRDGKPGLRRR